MQLDTIINQVLNEMIPLVGPKELETLKNSLYKNFYNIDIKEKNTEIIVYTNKNERMLRLYEMSKRVEQLAQSTINHYLRETNKFLLFIGKDFDEITAIDIRCYLAVISERKVSAVHIDNIRKYIKGFFKWCVENEYLTRDPFLKIKKIKCPAIKKEILTDSEIKRLQRNSSTLMERALLSLLSNTGLRVSECSGLNVKNINFVKREITVFAIKTRTTRTVYLKKGVLRFLREYLRCRNIKSFSSCNEPLFLNQRGSRLSCASIESMLKRIATKSHIKKKCTVHIFRRSLATLLFSNGMPSANIAVLLGHASSSTTEQYYVMANQQMIKEDYYKYSA